MSEQFHVVMYIVEFLKFAIMKRSLRWNLFVAVQLLKIGQVSSKRPILRYAALASPQKLQQGKDRSNLYR